MLSLVLLTYTPGHKPMIGFATQREIISLCVSLGFSIANTEAIAYLSLLFFIGGNGHESDTD